MRNEIRDQFVRDMQVAGFLPATQDRYLRSVQGFFKECWLAADLVTEDDVQDFFILLRERQVARETFHGYRYALQFFFVNTLGRDWALFKKNCKPRRVSVCPWRWNTRTAWLCWRPCLRRYTGACWG